MLTAPSPWTEADDAIPRRVYPAGGLDVAAAAFPARTRNAVSIHASRLGLLSPCTRGLGNAGPKKPHPLHRCADCGALVWEWKWAQHDCAETMARTIQCLLRKDAE